MSGTEKRVRVRAASARWGLTARQGQVLETLVLGLSNKELARRLGCAVKTIEIHVSAILAKAAVPTRASLIATFWTSPAGARP